MTTILVRRIQGPLRYIGARGWVSLKQRARKFPTTYDALLFCLERDFQDTEVLVDFAEPNAVLVVIRPGSAAAAPPNAHWFDAEHNFAFA